MRDRTIAPLVLSLVLLGCVHERRSVLPAPRLAPANTATAFIDADAARARAAGASAVQIVATGAGAAGDSIGGRIEAPGESCLLLLARGGPSIDDLDLFAYADDGTALGTDETSLSAASLLVCPPHPKHIYAFARVAAGHGPLALSAQLVPPRDADRAARAVSARERLRGPVEQADPTKPTSPTPAAGWPGLEDALVAHRREIGGTWREVRRVAIPLEPRFPTRLTGVIEAGQCLDVFVAPSDDVAYTELVVLSAEGRLLGQTPPEREHPALVVCSPEHAEVTFALRPHGGRGLAAIVMSVATSVLAPRDDVFLYEAEAARSLPEAITALDSQLSPGTHGAPRRLADGMAQLARHTSIALDLPPGCSRVDVVGGAPLRGLDTWLWAADGSLIAHGDGPARTTTFACSATAQRARLDVEAITRGGPFAVERRHLDVAPSALTAFVARPLAAGRLLGKALPPGPGSAPADAGDVTSVMLTPSALVAREAVVPAGQCLTVTLGLGPAAEGAELRLVAAETGDELSFVRGTSSAISESCAPRTPIRLRIELRVVAGTTEGLVSLRARAAPRAP